MRELSVYYCLECGHYAYHQLPKKAICPKCDQKLKILDMPYYEFMDLNCQQRDELLSLEILKNCPSVVKRITQAHKTANSRELIASMSALISELENENQKLNETVAWMHETIWKMVRKEKRID